MTQRHLDFHPTRSRTRAAHERLVDLLRNEGPCSTYRVMAKLKVKDVPHLVGRANFELRVFGERIENLSAPGEVARYAICEDLTSPERRTTT